MHAPGYLAHKPKHEERSASKQIIEIPRDGVKSEHKALGDSCLMAHCEDAAGMSEHSRCKTR